MSYLAEGGTRDGYPAGGLALRRPVTTPRPRALKQGHMQLPRVLVCGTNYGRTYLEAIHLAGETYRLAGILARGSTRSLMLTQRHCVPLYRSLEDLPAEID